MNTITKKDEGPDRPTYDARQRYYDLLVDRLSKAQDYSSMGQLRLWYQELFGFYSMVAPWLSTKDDERLDQKIQDIDKRLNQIDTLETENTTQWATMAHTKKRAETRTLLFRFQIEVIRASKHMMLPAGEKEEELNIERFLEESG